VCFVCSDSLLERTGHDCRLTLQRRGIRKFVAYVGTLKNFGLSDLQEGEDGIEPVPSEWELKILHASHHFSHSQCKGTTSFQNLKRDKTIHAKLQNSTII
jgi:hypothetical protein